MRACALLFLLGATHAFAFSSHVPQLRIQKVAYGDPLILSKIDFSTLEEPSPLYAGIAILDPLTSCPLETLPLDLTSAVDQVLSKAKESLADIKSSRASECAALQGRLESSRNQLSEALKNQFISSGATIPNTNQDLINIHTQQANAVNTFMLTATDMFHKECIPSAEDKVIVQKLIGQVMTLTGLFMGGWQGLSVAASGQFLGNLPLFRDDIDSAVLFFQKYSERGYLGSFLCRYRQMMKMSAILFSNPSDAVIGGFDLSQQTGPALVTRLSLENLEMDYPGSIHDVQLLHSIYLQSEGRRLESFESLKAECQNLQLGELVRPDMHPEDLRAPVVAALLYLKSTCETIDHLGWSALDQAKRAEVVRKSADSLTDLRDYYEHLQKDLHSPMGKVVRTWESQQYFKRLKESLDEYRNPNTGNQTRLNFRILTETLGDSLAWKSFHTLMNQNYETLNQKSRWTGKYSHAPAIRQRAIGAMLDLCQTLDPTLAGLTIDRPDSSKLLREWERACMGPRSYVCASIQGRGESLLEDTSAQSYFNSLCGNMIVITSPPVK